MITFAVKTAPFLTHLKPFKIKQISHLLTLNNLTYQTVLTQSRGTLRHYKMTNNSTIDFYFMAESPPCRAVEMVAKMIGVTLNKHSINLFTKEHLKDDYLKLNPLHNVPFIVDGDLKIGESRAITAYLVNKYAPANSTIYPSDPVQRALVDEILYLDATLLYPAGSKLLRPKLFGAVKELDAENEKAYRIVLQYFDDRLKNNKGKKFMLGDSITIGDISLAATFTFPEACDYKLSEFPHLVAYLGNLALSIPDYALINEKPVENMRNFMKSKQ